MTSSAFGKVMILATWSSYRIIITNVWDGQCWGLSIEDVYGTAGVKD